MLLLACLPFFPLVSFALLIGLGKRLSQPQVAFIGISGVALSALASAVLLYQLSLTQSGVITAHLWSWFELAGKSAGLLNAKADSVAVNISFYLDALSAVMICVVSGVGLLIHIFAGAYMSNDANFSRFMAYMNLFIVAMLILVLADNLVLLYLGWEGVGLCSFLLIGFWYHEKANVLAARKAFIVTRIGDTAMIIGLFLLFDGLGELNIIDATQKALSLWQVGDQQAYWIALLLLGGAVGKSAQLPLQTWLPDAMAGPTPVSALIHAATMVTAGVYLIARMQGIFLLAPEVMQYVAWLGALTLLLAGAAALAQSDIKRVLAYSTMSQIGYMMLALGAGAWSSAVFHLMTHAFFKALLFLTAGLVILALHHQQDLFKMGGLLKRLPFEATLFIIGLICLMALPGTSGFFSKEEIIAALWSSTSAGPLLWWCGILGALLTSIYSCRLFFLAFLGTPRDDLHSHEHNSHEHNSADQYSSRQHSPALNIGMLRLPLILLAVLALFGGMLAPDLGAVFNSNIVYLADNQTLQLQLAQVNTEPFWLHPVAIATPFIGIAFSWFYFSAYRQSGTGQQSSGQNQMLQASQSPLAKFCRNGLGFDVLYSKVLVKPYCFIARLNKNDIFDQLLMLNAWYVRLWNEALCASQTGGLRWYAVSIGIGLVCLIGVVIL
jgi:NADH-quinone oxidoreductase subunit L